MAERAELVIAAQDKASKELSKIGKIGTSAFKSMAKSMAPLIGVLGFAGLAMGATRLASSIIESSSSIETFETRLIAMNKSTEIGKAKLKALSDFATSAPFSTAKVIEAGVTLEAFGLAAEENIDILADLAAFMGTDIKDAASAMGRAFAGGAGAADIFRERGILQVIKDSKGINDLTKLTLPEFREAMMEAFTDPGGKISGGVELLKNTFKGAMDTMEGVVFNVKTAIGNALLPTLTKFVSKNLIPVIEKTQIWIKENEALMEMFGTTFVKILETTIKIITGLTSKIVGLADVINRFGIKLGLWADTASETEKKQRKLDQQVEASKGKIKTYTEAWRNALKAETEGTAITTKHVGALGGASDMLTEYNKIQRKSSQDLMNLIAAENAHLIVLKKKQAEMTPDQPKALPEVAETALPGPTPEQVETRNFVLEAKELEHLERRFALLTDDQSRELALLDVKHEKELLKLEEQLANRELKQADHDAILAEMADVKEIQDLERKALFQAKKDDIDKKALADKQKRIKQDRDFISKVSEIDLALYEKTENKKLAVFTFTQQAMSSIASSLYTAFGKKSRTLFEIAKASNIAQAVMNTYQGATKAFSQYGWPMGAVAAAAVIAQGMGQVATIRAQKMAEGGIVTGPTHILAGEAGPEKIIPLDRAEEEGFGATSDQPITINFNGPILGDEDQAKEFALAIDEELYNLKSQGQSLAFA